jgi:hypothetical protein
MFCQPWDWYTVIGLWHWVANYLGWITTGGITLALAVFAMLRKIIYRRTLRKLSAARQRLFVKSPEERGGIAWEAVTDEMIIKEARAWKWLARFALNWQQDKKKGLV